MLGIKGCVHALVLGGRVEIEEQDTVLLRCEFLYKKAIC